MTNRSGRRRWTRCTAAIETPNGELGFYVVADGSGAAVPGADAAAVVHPLRDVPAPDRGPSAQRRGGGAGQPEHHRGGAGPIERCMPMLSDDCGRRSERTCPRYPSKQAVTLPALHLVHDELRCVPLEAIREIADLLDLQPGRSPRHDDLLRFFRDEDDPLGKTRLWVCRSLACMLRGGDELLDALLRRSSACKPGGTTRRRQDHAGVRRVHRRLRRRAGGADRTTSTCMNVDAGEGGRR